MFSIYIYIANLAEGEVIQYLASVDLEEGEPQRECSNWGRFCPVTSVEENLLIQVSQNYPVSYRGFIYFTSSESHASRFVANPDRYLEIPPVIPSLRICVLGGPFTGKSTQSKMLAKIYNLKYLSIDELLLGWDEEPDQRTLLKNNLMYAKVVKRLKIGKTVPPEMSIELIRMMLEDSKDETSSKGVRAFFCCSNRIILKI